MMQGTKAWVVYKMTIPKQEEKHPAVCSQAEWDALDRTRPGYHTLVRSGITGEAEAERLARELTIDEKAQPA